MSDYLLHPPTPSFFGLRLRTKNGDADLQAKSLTQKGPWVDINKENVTGQAEYIVTVVTEAYKAGYQDGMRRPIKDRVLAQKGFIDEI